MSRPITDGTADGYRSSHLAKGADYDERVGTDPWAQYMTRRESAILCTVVDQLFPSLMPRYGDFACGTGRITQLLESRAIVSIGVDVSETMLREARVKCQRTTFVHADLTREPVDFEPFDLVTAFRFFGNAEADLRVAALGALAKMVKPGGYLVANNHRNPVCLRHILRGRQTNRQTLTYFDFRRMLAAVGFSIEQAYGIGAWIHRTRGLGDRLEHAGMISRVIEAMSANKALAALSPDMVIVARRAGGST
jgi:SAM-dependent methyltransferase